jgi:hypothetical protein
VPYLVGLTHEHLPSGLKVIVTLLRFDHVSPWISFSASSLNLTQSTEALRQAILEYPSVVPLLADKAEIGLSAEVRSHPAFRIFTHHGCADSSCSVSHILIYS